MTSPPTTLWSEIGALTAIMVASVSALAWVYKQLQRLIENRFDRIERKLSRTRREARQAKKLAKRAIEITSQTRQAVGTRRQDNANYQETSL